MFSKYTSQLFPFFTVLLIDNLGICYYLEKIYLFAIYYANKSLNLEPGSLLWLLLSSNNYLHFISFEGSMLLVAGVFKIGRKCRLFSFSLICYRFYRYDINNRLK